MTERLTQLKAQAYDAIHAIEQAKQVLRQLNEQIQREEAKMLAQEKNNGDQTHE